MSLFTYEIILESQDGCKRNEFVTAETYLSALDKAKAMNGMGWEVVDCKLIRVD